MDDDNPGMYHSESDDSDGQQTVEYGGDRWRSLREDPRHEAFNLTGLNLSQVLTVIYEVSHGINYHTSKHLVKCGVHGDTQVRNSFETLLKIGHYDDITNYVRPDALVTESLPTADSGSRSQHTYDPDGSMKAMLLRGWFSKGGVGENWRRAFMPSVNVDTGLTEPFKLKVFKYTAAGIPTFKHAFKRKSVFTNRKKCMVCYKSMRQAFADQEAYVNGGAREANDADEMEARQRPVSMGFIGVGYGAVTAGEDVFSTPLWVKFFTLRFTGIQHLYRMVCDIIPDLVERIQFWIGIAALNHEFTLENSAAHVRLMFHVYSFRDFVYSVQAGRFNDLVLLARKSEEKNPRDFKNEILLTRLRNLLALGERVDYDGRVITLDDYTNVRLQRLAQLQFMDPTPEWISVFNVVEIDVSAVSSRVEAFLTPDTLKLKFLKDSFKFIAGAWRQLTPTYWNNVMDKPLRETEHRYPVQSLKDFVDAILAENYDGILSSLHTWGKVLLLDLNSPPDFDLILGNIKIMCVLLQGVVAFNAGVIVPGWVDLLNNPLSTSSVNKFFLEYLKTEEGKTVLRDFKENLADLCALLRSLNPTTSLRYNQRTIVPKIDSMQDFFGAVQSRRFDSLISQILNSARFFTHFTVKAVLENFEVLIVPQWIITFNRHVNVAVVYELLHRFSERGEIPHGGILQFKSCLVELIERVRHTDTSWDLQLNLKISPYIDSFKNFIVALLDRRFDELVAQIFVSTRSSRYYNLSVVFHNFELLISEINKKHPQAPGDVQPLVPVLPEPLAPEPLNPVPLTPLPESEGVQPGSNDEHPSFPDFDRARNEKSLRDITISHPSESEFSENWVSRLNELHSESDIETLYQECTSSFNIQERLNFVKHLGEFIHVLVNIGIEGGAASYEQYKKKRTRPKRMDFFAKQISMKLFPRLIGSILRCIDESLPYNDYLQSIKHDPSIKFNPCCKLDNISESLNALHVKSLEMNNKVFYVGSDFVIPQWVLDFTDPMKKDDEAVNAMYGDLLIYLPNTLYFDNFSFMKCLNTMVRYMKKYSFRGLLIKCPIVTMSQITSSIFAVQYDELCATVYYDPSGQSGGRFELFKTRFELFAEHCNTHLPKYFQEKQIKDREEFELKVRESEAKKNQLPRDLYHAPGWMQKICIPESSFEILNLWNQMYNSYEEKYMFWKLLQYFVYRIDHVFSIKDKPQSTPITSLEVFMHAVADKRFDYLLFCVHTYAKSEKTKELMVFVLNQTLNEMKAQARDEEVQYVHDFREWKTERDKSDDSPQRVVHPEQDGSDSPPHVIDDVNAAELSDWLAYRPVDFEILIEDDKDTVGDFQWVFELVGFSSLACAEYTLHLKDVLLEKKTQFFEKLPKFIRCLEKFKLNSDSTQQSKHRKIYSWRDFVIAVTETTNHVHLAKIMTLCDGKRLDYRRFYIASGINKLREIYDHLKSLMDKMTPTKTTFETALVLFKGQDYQLVTHSYPTEAVVVGESIENFVVKPPVKTVRDSLFGCIKDSMANLLNSGVKPHLLYFPSFFKDFQHTPGWCDNQRREILDSLLLSQKKIEIYHSETRTKSAHTVKELVLKKYFPHDNLRLQSSEAVKKFTQANRISEMVDAEMMQLISDRYNLIVALTYPNLVKKIRRRRVFVPDVRLGEFFPRSDESSLQGYFSLRETGKTVLKAPVSRDGVENNDSDPPVPLPEPHEYGPVHAPPSQDDDDVSFQEVADTVVFTPTNEQLPWEDHRLYTRRRDAYQVKIYLKYSRGETMADGTTYTGYQSLIAAEMTEVFSFDKIDNVMQRNVVDMLLKFQKQCAPGDLGFTYDTKIFNVHYANKQSPPFIPKYDFFVFSVPGDFLVRLVSQDLLGAGASDDDLFSGWNMFVKQLQKQKPFASPRPGSAQEELVNTIYPNLESFEFDNFVFSVNSTNNPKFKYWVRGVYDYLETERNWRTELYDKRNWDRYGGSIFDSVQLTRSDNRLLPPFAVDLVFESVHLTATPEKESEASFYLTCIWVSLLSYIFHPSVLKVSDVELSKEQYYFISAIIARQNSVDKFREFVWELCKRKQNDLKQELASIGGGSEAEKKDKLEYQKACAEVMAQLEDRTLAIEFNASHKRVIATVLNLIIIESELTPDMRLSPDRAHFVMRTCNDIVGRDSFYINSDVYPSPDLFKDPVRFMIRKDFTPVALSNDVFQVQIDDFDILQEYKWKCGEPKTFFSCIAETCFLAQNEGSGKREYLYANQSGEPDENRVHADLIYILNRIFEWYCQGTNAESRYSSAEAANPSMIAINESFFKVKSIITYIVEFHWDSIAMALGDQNVDRLPVFSGVVTVKIWDAFLQFMASDEYVPSLFEMQVLADYLCINICVFSISGYTTMEVKIDAVDGKKVPFVFTPLVASKQVLSVAETVDGYFQVMSPVSTLPDAKPSFSQPFFITRNMSERFRSVTCMRPTKSIASYIECSIVLNSPSEFYHALARFLQETNQNNIPRINIFRHVERISQKAFVNIVDVFIFVVTEIFNKFFFLNGDGSDAIEIHEFLKEMADSMKEEWQEGVILKRNVIELLKKNNAGIKHMFASKFHSGGTVLQQLSEELDTVESRSMFQAQYHAIIAADDFEEAGNFNTFLSIPDGMIKTFEQLRIGMQNWLRSARRDIRHKILYHHYGRRIREEREKHGKAKDKKLLIEKFESGLWDSYCKDEFLKSIPSEFEFEQIATMLRVRLMVFSDAWTRSTRKLLKYKGTHERLYDTGFNKQNPLVFLIGANNTFSIMMFKKPIELRSEKDISAMEYQSLIENCRNKWNKDVIKLEEGRYENPPKDPILYKLVGLNPNVSRRDILKDLTTARVRKPMLMIHTDRLDNIVNGKNAFRPTLGEFGPQSLEEVMQILEYFEHKLGMERNKITEMVDLAWQTITDENFRYIYHVECKFLPFSMRRPFSLQAPGDTGGGLGEDFEKWSFTHDVHAVQSLVDQNTYYRNFVKRIPVFMQVKGRFPDYQKFDMKTSKEKQWDYGGLMSNVLRDRSVASFRSRFNVSRRWGDDELPSNVYAVMLPVQKSFSHIKCRPNEYKVYITRDPSLENGEVYRTRINIFSTVLHGEIPDMKTQTPSAESDFEAKAKWSNDWCGLKMCIQTAFFFARHNSLFKKFLLQHIGDTEDLFRFDWLENFLTPEQEDGWSLYTARNSPDAETLNFYGITNPYNVNYSTLRDAIHILFKTGERVLQSGDHIQKVKDILTHGEYMFRTEGQWDSDENISEFFEKIDLSDEYDDHTARSISKRKKSTVLMRFLGMAFNVEFVILKSFPENDVNSLTFDDDCFYYYTVKENGQDVRIRDLKHTFINRRGLYWCNNPTSSENVYNQKLLSKRGIESSPVKACPLPVFVIWENDKWNILRWKSFHNVGVAEELMQKKYKEQIALREKVKNQKELKFGGDWKGKILHVGGGGAGPAPGNGGGLGHFSADECDEAGSDSDRSSDWEDSDDDDWSDSDDSYGEGGDSDNERHARDRRERFNNYMHGTSHKDPKALWGKGMPRSMPSWRSEHYNRNPGGGGASVPSEPRNRGWETATRSEFSLSARGPGKPRNYRKPPFPSDDARHVSFDEDQKEIHFMTQKVPMAVNVLKYLAPYGCCDLKLQCGQMEQTKILAVIFACCFDKAIIVPIKRCYTTRMMVACKGLRKDIVALLRVRQMLKKCFDLKESSFHSALSELYQKNVVPAERIDDLMQQVQSASDELWADDFRCSLIMARSYIQATLEGKVSPAPEYLSPELADLMNSRVFSKVTPEQRRMNQEMIRTLMKSNIGDQLLPLFRVVFHPDLHTWRLTLPRNYKKVTRDTNKHNTSPKYWKWDVPAAAAAAMEFKRQRMQTL